MTGPTGFGFDSYPDVPGYQKRDTSKDAAERVTEVRQMQEAIIASLRAWGDMTFYEMAEFLGKDSRRVQPRMSELAKQGKIVDSGKRHDTPYGRKGIAWRAV